MRLDIAGRLTGAALALATLAGGLPAMAQEQTPFKMTDAQAAKISPERLKLANELLVANGEGSSFDTLIPGIIEQAAGSFVQANPDLIRDLREVAKQLAPQYENRRQEIVQILARIYAVQFDETELKDLLTFYRSAVGRKLVENRGKILDAGLAGIQAWSTTFTREMEVKVREEMKKRGFTI